VPVWHKRLRNVTILNRDAFELFERIDDHPSTAIYVDPPYLKKGSKYIHDFDDGDHKRLAAALSTFKKARIVVSYYDDPRLCDMYPGWSRDEITVTKALSNQGMRAKKNAKASKVIEVLLVNQSDTEGLF
jgi:DNA adenine methylase